MNKTMVLIVSILLFFGTAFALTDARLLRTPDINGDLVVFVYAGDIWRVSSDGGDAKRLTSHEGLELFPKISPDKKWIAFSAEYSGSRQVYIIPSEGGTPVQLTYYNDVGIMPPRGGYDNVIMDWTHDSNNILVRMNRTPYGERMGKYFLVDIKGGLEKPLNIPECGGGSFSPDGNKIVYTPISREFRTWKRTKGGRAQDVWIYDLQNDRSKRITTFSGTDRHPIWFGSKIFYVSDESLTLNFHSYDVNTEEFSRVTGFNDFDVLWPSGSNGMIVFEKGGFLYKLDTGSSEVTKISVNISFDNPDILPYFKNVSEFVSRFGATIGSDGKRAFFDARGDLFSVPAEKEGVTLNLTRTSGIREMYPAASPDGKFLSYISDETGDYEFYIVDTKGKTKPVKLTETKVWKYPGEWSPDSRYIIFSDADRKLQLLDTGSKSIKLIDRDNSGTIRDYSWSPDSRWVTYTKREKNKLNSIWVYSLDSGASTRLTGIMYEESSPRFSLDGNYLFFVSDRDFNFNFNNGFSTIEFDFVYNQTARMYAIALNEDSPPLFKNKNDLDENKVKAAAGPAKDKKEKKSEKAAVNVKIDFKNINNRVTVFPLPTGQYRGIHDLGNGKVLYLDNNGLNQFDLEKKKSELILANIRFGSISADNKTILYRSGSSWGITEIKPGLKAGDGKLEMNNVVMKIEPVKEWKQIYNEGWRIYRDWFYVRNMHGVDWEKMRKKYEVLLPYISHRADLDFIFGELVGELNVGHTYVNWGDFKKVKRLDTGLLGAVLEADQPAGFYRIKKIYNGENWNESTRSPLTEPGIDVNEGDYIVKINGYDVTLNDNPYRFLENTAGKTISLTVSNKPGSDAVRTYWIRPVSSELGLMYHDYIESRRKLVEKLSGGKIGYIHVPDTHLPGNRELFKGIYAFNDKEALIIDDRYNGGGWSPSKMIEKLSTKTYAYWQGRDLELTPAPLFSFNGPLAMLINHYSSSGGDNFPYWFKLKKLGKLIGTRTWGGLVGYGWSPGLVDGPSFAVPMSAIVNTDGEYVVEGVGIYPDEGFEVYDIPEEIAGGNDPSIEKAVKHLLELIKKSKFEKPESPKDPDRSKWFEKEIK